MEPLLKQALSVYNRHTSFYKNAIKICGISCCYLLIRSIYIGLYRKYLALPPGPIGYPIFGCFISMATKGPKFYIEMARMNNSDMHIVSSSNDCYHFDLDCSLEFGKGCVNVLFCIGLG